MMKVTKKTVITAVGVGCTIIGAGCLAYVGVAEGSVVALVGAVFVIVSLVINFFR